MENEITNNDQGQIIYDRTKALEIPKPVFKPGNTPHTQFGTEILNANVPWPKIVAEIQTRYTQEKLAEEVGVAPITLHEILKQNYEALSFRIGARILGIHTRLFPEVII
jgi:lambda repressor-like predicted transcriptional regulator